ncbi:MULTISPECIES: ribose-5-phosphate isomerase RpiA [Methylosinus]|uniref:Ribose-5-phosphate isomerase A n=1 Tax=Methylosinus trichosporium (strain ATCC 35070 / NCIMB 11131 / UNIQEM 75 / OB3b) TaxID=595536 RepID=A0A2D2D1Q8_METT3|nr:MULTISPECIES: ribose-5-phosphate isomerase RpiA [Methylosinus]ATQ68912.1 ribose-5-phosphate isomerase RpiA [Methylosinus trichosporium OB3b]OBS52294.1 ribose 5-phosphate isomerase A [Methylosinus sp. 3S-1]
MPVDAADDMKKRAAAAALAAVAPGMRLGLGTGSTAAHFVALLGERVREGLDILCVPTSERTRAQAEALAIPLATLDEAPELDLTVDGADEFDSSLRLVKGGGGALLREKIVAAASRRFIVVADATKRVETLGAFPLPVEIDAFGARATRGHVERAAAALGLSGEVRLRSRPDGHVFVTDGGHLVLDCAFGAIPAPEALADRLAAIPGVVEHGLFLGLATAVVVAGPGGVESLGRLD